MEGPGEFVAAVGGSMTICPVIDDSELFVCRPGSFVDVGAILFILILLLLSDKLECKIFSLLDKQLFWFSPKASSTFNEKKFALTMLKLSKLELTTHDDDLLLVVDDDNDGDLGLKQEMNSVSSVEFSEGLSCMQRRIDSKLNEKLCNLKSYATEE